MKQTPDRLIAGCFAGLALGAVGVAVGCLGPIALNTGGNQGPLLGMVLGPAAAVVGFVAGYAWPYRSPKSRKCRGCGYDLRGILTGVCPECGPSLACT